MSAERLPRLPERDDLITDRKLALSFGGLVLVLMLVVLGAASIMYLRLQRDEEVRLSRALATVLSESISKVTFAGRYHARLFLEEIQKRVPEFRFITVENAEGIVVAHSDAKLNGTAVEAEARERSRECFAAGTTQVTVLTEEGVGRYREVIIPYRSGADSSILGVVRVGIDARETREAFGLGLGTLLAMVFAMTLAAMWAVYLLSRYFGRGLRESEADLRGIIENTPDPFYRTDTEGRLALISPSGVRLLGYRKASEMLGRNAIEFWRDPTQRAKLLARLEREEVVYDFETELLRADGSAFPVSISARAKRDAAGRSLGVEGLWRDITERKRAAEELQRSERRLALAITATSDAIWEWNLATKEAYYSPRWYQMLGYADQELAMSVDSFQRLCHPDDFAVTMERIKDLVDGRSSSYGAEFRMQCKDGRWRWILGRGNVVQRDVDGRPLMLAGTNADVTERVLTERILRSSLEEKTVLLKEVHHRVKNNLQIVCSLMNLQADNSRQPEAVAALQETRDRVRSMALLHEVLYRSENLARIDFSAYLESIVAHLVRAHGARGAAVKFEFELVPVSLEIDQAVSCGLIVNELVSNALKHAFPGNREGRVWVRLAREEAGSLRLEVCDDGEGFATKPEMANQTTLGLQLVGMLAEKLDAEIVVKNNPGACFCLRFSETAK